MNAQHFRDERNTVSAVISFSYLSVIGDASRRSNESSQVHGRDARDLESQVALAANLSLRNGIAFAVDAFSLRVRSFTGHLDGERRSFNVMIGELQVHDVISRFGWAVRDVQGAVLMILAFDFSFARAFDGEGKTTKTRLASINIEGVVCVSFAFMKGGAGDEDFLCVTDFTLGNLDLKWRSSNLLAHAFDGNMVISRFARSERDSLTNMMSNGMVCASINLNYRDCH